MYIYPLSFRASFEWLQLLASQGHKHGFVVQYPTLKALAFDRVMQGTAEAPPMQAQCSISPAQGSLILSFCELRAIAAIHRADYILEQEIIIFYILSVVSVVSAAFQGRPQNEE